MRAARLTPLTSLKNSQPRPEKHSRPGLFLVRMIGRGPVSRILSSCGHSSRRRVTADTHQRPTRRFRQMLKPPGRIGPMRGASLAFGLRFPPYLVLLRVGFTLPQPLQAERCALAAPFHPYSGADRPNRRTCRAFPGCPAGRERSGRGSRGGIFSVALAVHGL
jgi:hypothetical protein